MFSRLIGVIFLFYTAACTAEEADSKDRLTLIVGPYVFHFHNNPDHNNKPWLTGLEWDRANSWIDFGAVFFHNSFNQPSVYAYVGKRWFPGDDEQGFYVKLTGGPLYGYRGQYEDKVPFNQDGLALAIIPGIGYQYRSVDA
ncbi:MAG: hypothetical protein IAF94_24170, partial [Pirellulaceae bacterium]|nr:hypothetical protein [Pirellulaceae bacterium]